MKVRRTIGTLLVILGGLAIAVGMMFWLNYPWLDGGALVMFGLVIGVPLLLVGAVLLYVREQR